MQAQYSSFCFTACVIHSFSEFSLSLSTSRSAQGDTSVNAFCNDGMALTSNPLLECPLLHPMEPQRWIVYQNPTFCMVFSIVLPSLYWNMNSFRFIHQKPHSEVRHLEFQVNATECLIQLQRWVAYQNVTFCMLFNIGLSLYWNMNSFRVIH